MNWSAWIVSCGGLGWAPKAPGTVGSLGGLVFWGGFLYLWPYPPLYWAALLLFCFLGTFFIQDYERRTQKEDPSEVVIDEWVGIGFSLAFVEFSWMALGIGFLLFRLFDISKPPGVRFFDDNHLKSWGTMLDDVVAGLYAGFLLWLLSFYGFLG